MVSKDHLNDHSKSNKKNCLIILNENSNSLEYQTGHQKDTDEQFLLLAMSTINLRASI